MHTLSYVSIGNSLTLIAGTMLLAASPLAAQVGLGLVPMRVEFAAQSGRGFSGTLMLTNSSTRKTRVRTELLDFFVNQDTTPQFVADAPSEKDYSCRSWLTVNPMELEMEPKSQVAVRYTVRLPADAPPRSYHCAVGFVTLLPAEEITGMGLRTAVRVVSVIYPVVGKPPINGEIKELKLEPVDSATGPVWRAVVVLENAGLMLFRPVGELEIVDSAGRVIETDKLPSFPVLPMRRQRFLLPLAAKLAPGQYSLRARVEVGSEIQQATSAAAVAEAPAQ